MSRSGRCVKSPVTQKATVGIRPRNAPTVERRVIQKRNVGEGESEKLCWYDWLADSGSSSHITKIRSALTDYVPLNEHRVTGIGNESLTALGKGTIELVSTIGRQQIKVKLRNVLYVPSTSNNLISITRLDKEGGNAHMENGRVILSIKGGCTIVKGRMANGLYKLDTQAQMYSKTRIQIAQETKN